MRAVLSRVGDGPVILIAHLCQHQEHQEVALAPTKDREIDKREREKQRKGHLKEKE